MTESEFRDGLNLLSVLKKNQGVCMDSFSILAMDFIDERKVSAMVWLKACKRVSLRFDWYPSPKELFNVVCDVMAEEYKKKFSHSIETGKNPAGISVVKIVTAEEYAEFNRALPSPDDVGDKAKENFKVALSRLESKEGA